MSDIFELENIRYISLIYIDIYVQKKHVPTSHCTLYTSSNITVYKCNRMTEIRYNDGHSTSNTRCNTSVI